jgi:hypothetical protein
VIPIKYGVFHRVKKLHTLKFAVPAAHLDHESLFFPEERVLRLQFTLEKKVKSRCNHGALFAWLD